jgi:hypothetical protein
VGWWSPGRGGRDEEDEEDKEEDKVVAPSPRDCAIKAALKDATVVTTRRTRASSWA